jgi:hypothetical protein
VTKDEKLKDMREHPGRHHHTYDDLMECCIVDGYVDLYLVESHGILCNTNVRGWGTCDVIKGPCRCGAWH